MVSLASDSLVHIRYSDTHKGVGSRLVAEYVPATLLDPKAQRFEIPIVEEFRR